MSLKARLGKAVQRRIEAMPSVQAAKARSERIAPIQHAAHRAAYSRLDDEAARNMLSEQLQADRAALKEATIDLARRRDDYINDRAYRLLSAAAAGTAVLPVPPERTDLFAAEEKLGRLALESAFDSLAELEPCLLDMRDQVRTLSPRGTDATCAPVPAHIKQQLAELFGRAAADEPEVLHTSLATSIAHQYLQLLAGDTRAGPADVAYFDHPRKMFVFVTSGRLWGGRRPRPGVTKGSSPI
jgi:hypothetical protein